tara:strand:+ start:252 stop:398 length:147 start_codon:yes stop_codon:yes gene_type:complete
MPANIDGLEMLERKENQETTNGEYSLMGGADQSDSELTWIKLHRMFDK